MNYAINNSHHKTSLVWSGAILHALQKYTNIYWTSAKWKVNNGLVLTVKFTTFRLQFEKVVFLTKKFQFGGGFLKGFSSETLGENSGLRMVPVLCSRHRVRPWLLEKRLHHRKYKLEKKAPETVDIDRIKSVFMRLYEMTREQVRALI